MQLLMLGPLPPPYGGTTVEFETLVRELSEIVEPTDTVDVLNTNLSPLNRLMLPLRILRSARAADILFLHCSPRGALVICPYLMIFRRLLRKAMLVRISGGVFADYYCSCSRPVKYLLDTAVFGSDAVLFETKHHVEYFKDQHASAQWFPNSRPFATDEQRGPLPSVCDAHDRETQPPIKVVYFGHIRETKGVTNLVAAARQLPDVDIDVYGPFMDHLDESLFNGSHVKYRGVVPGKDVMTRMAEYDLLLFPTFYQGEGYPGVIIESKVAGLALITTHWLRIPEIVEDEVTGLLIRPDNIDDIVQSVQRLCDDRKLLHTLKQNAYASASSYNLKNWCQKFLAQCRQLIA